MTGTTEGNTGSRGRTAGAYVRAIVAAVVLGSPAQVWSMAADGALITNIVAATYHGMAGYPGAPATPYAPGYRMSYLATATVLVSCPVVAITKRAAPTTQSVDGTVTFEICSINSSLQASAWNIVITDRLMDNMEYNGAFASWPAAGWTASWSSNNAAPWTNGQPGIGQDPPYFLRWTITTIAPGRSACISFQTRVL